MYNGMFEKRPDLYLASVDFRDRILNKLRSPLALEDGSFPTPSPESDWLG